MKTRVISSIVALPILLLFGFLGGIPMKAACLLVSLIGLKEIYQAFFNEFKLISLTGYVACIFYVGLIDIISKEYLIFILTLLILITFAFMVICHTTVTIYDAVTVIFGFLYVPFLLTNVYLTRQLQEGGSYLVWLIFISAWGCDSGAYMFGVTFGKRKLIPTLSPNKTIEGSIGGVLTSAVLGGLYAWFISEKLASFENHVLIISCVIICSLGAVLAQFGDLTASAIKRTTKIKDFGNVMPGHGGVVDRFDSILFTAPVIYLGFLLFVNTVNV